MKNSPFKRLSSPLAAFLIVINFIGLMPLPVTLADPPSLPPVALNEVKPVCAVPNDPTDKEWFEFQNLTASTLDLSQFHISLLPPRSQLVDFVSFAWLERVRQLLIENSGFFRFAC